MSLSTKNIKTESKVSKTLYPGNITARIYDIQLTPGFNADSYHLVLSLESAPMGGDFEGFFIDKDDQSKGRFQGQIGRVKYSQYAFEDKTLPSGIVINRDQNILRSLAAIAKSLGLSEQLDSITADTIEDFVAKAKVILTDSEAGYLYLCLGGRAYTDKNGYTKYDLHLVKSKNKKYAFADIDHAENVVEFDESEHLVAEKKKAVETVSDFEPEGNSDFEF
jgi:hypothetical protein